MPFFGLPQGEYLSRKDCGFFYPLFIHVFGEKGGKTRQNNDKQQKRKDLRFYA